MKYICIKDFLQHLEKGQVYDVETTMMYGMKIYILCNGHVKLSDETLPEYLRPYLQVGDCFQQTWTWKDRTKPMWFKVLDINREKNWLKVECHSVEGYSHEEDWDDLDVTEMAFDTGEYKMVNDGIVLF